MYCKQTQCSNQHIKFYGCYAFTLLTMVQELAQKALTLQECEELIYNAMSKGIIVDNDIPTTKNGWYRCYVASPSTFAKMAIDKLGGKGTLSEIIRGAPTLIEPKDTRFTVIEWATKTGSHFGLGKFNNGTLETIYDPWETLPRTGVKTVRFWRYTE